jgi:hypothetical protein
VTSDSKQDATREHVATAATVGIVLAAYLAAVRFNLLPFDFVVPDTMGYGLALLIGLMASLSCVAVQADKRKRLIRLHRMIGNFGSQRDILVSFKLGTKL